jgi:hypothetical protein
MKTYYTVTLAMLAGCGLGAAAVQGLRAQSKPPIYYVVETETTDPEAYAKEFAPQAQGLTIADIIGFALILAAAAGVLVPAPSRAIAAS